MNYDCSIFYGLRLTTPIVDRGLGRFYNKVASRKPQELTNHNRLFFSHLTVIGQFLAACDLRFYCRTGLNQSEKSW